jgi:hypothetical protein
MNGSETIGTGGTFTHEINRESERGWVHWCTTGDDSHRLKRIKLWNLHEAEKSRVMLQDVGGQQVGIVNI